MEGQGSTEASLTTGNNPAVGALPKPSPLGISPNVAPTVTNSFVKPQVFSRVSGGRSRGFGGRLGEEGLKRGTGPIPSTGITASPNLSTDYSTGFPTNYQVPYARIVKRFKHPLMTAKQKYQLVVTQREQIDRASRRKGMESRRYAVLNIPAFNWLQARSELKPDSMESVKSADSVWNDWTVDGIVRTEVGETEPGESGYGKEERLFNILVKGYGMTFNGWGGVKNGTRLFLILKKQKISGEYELNPQGETDVTKIQKDSEFTDKPFQLSFWADPDHEYPTDEALQYTDEFGYVHRGVAIYIGVSERDATSKPTGRNVKDVNTKVSNLLAQNQLFIFLDP